MRWLVGVAIIIAIVLLAISQRETFLMRYVPMSDSFYYEPPWAPVPPIWRERWGYHRGHLIPLGRYRRDVVYDMRRPFHMIR